MCLAIPVEIISINERGDMAIVALEGVRKEISLALIENVAPGDFVLLHVGYALSSISAAEAEKTLALMAEAGLVSPGARP